MGFFNKMFGGRKEFPELDAESEAARRMQEVMGPLESLAGQVRDNLEVVPSDQGAFVFIGKPPKQFGLAWVEEGSVKSLKSVIQETGMDAKQVARLTEQLREAYEKSQEAPRFAAAVADRTVVVTPSPRLEREVGEIIENVAS